MKSLLLFVLLFKLCLVGNGLTYPKPQPNHPWPQPKPQRPEKSFKYTVTGNVKDPSDLSVSVNGNDVPNREPKEKKCIESGKPCGGFECCSGFCMGGLPGVCGRTPHCKPEDRPCKTGEECCSGFCFNHRCNKRTMGPHPGPPWPQPKPQRPGKSFKYTVTGNVKDPSDLSVSVNGNEVPNHYPKEKKCTESGRPCSGFECCSGACLGGVCARTPHCKELMHDCKTGEECCSGFCYNHHCNKRTMG